MKTNRYKQLDDILQALDSSIGFMSLPEISLKLKLPRTDTREMILALDYLTIIGFTDKDYRDVAPVFRITFKGRIYLENGGFEGEQKSRKWQYAWTITKTVAAILNALAVIYLTSKQANFSISEWLL